MPTESWVVTGPQVIEVEQVTSLRVGLIAGRVDVVAHDDDSSSARIEVHSVTGRPLEVSLAAGELKVGHPAALGGWTQFLEKLRYFSSKDSASVHIAVPREVRAKVGTVTAEGLLAGVEEDAEVSTVSGSIVTDSTIGMLKGNTVSGGVEVRDHTGDLRLSSVSGDVTAAGELNRVSADTVSGNVALDLTGEASVLKANTVSGDVTVRLAEGVGITVEAKSVSGRVVVDGVERTAGRPGKAYIDERSNGAGCYITSSTVSGHLTVLRASS